tara:strand:- start:1601 stop:2059 length:459 start_codon:yes stop_codon:yes gene_type:complete
MEIINQPNYLIYPDGKVFSKKRNKFLKIGYTQDGYEQVKMDSLTHRVHRLIAIHYLPNDDGLDFVDHINRKRDDNRLENLRWVSSSENGQNRTYTMNNNSGHKYISRRNDGYQYRKTLNKIVYSKWDKDLSHILIYKFFYSLKLFKVRSRRD